MPLPFLPLLGAAARTLGAGVLSRLGGAGLSAAMKGMGPVDVLALGRKLGTPNPSQDQIHAASMSQVGNAAKGAATALLGLPAAVLATGSAFESFAGGLLARRAQFEQLNAGIAQSFAQMRRQDVVLGVRTAAGVSGTTTALADAFMALREDTQPMKEAMMNLWNVVGIGVVQIARGISKVLDFVGFLALLEGISDLLTNWFGSSQENMEGIQTNLRDQLRELAKLPKRAEQNRPVAPAPGRGFRPDPEDRWWGF